MGGMNTGTSRAGAGAGARAGCTPARAKPQPLPVSFMAIWLLRRGQHEPAVRVESSRRPLDVRRIDRLQKGQPGDRALRDGEVEVCRRIDRQRDARPAWAQAAEVHNVGALLVEQ